MPSGDRPAPVVARSTAPLSSSVPTAPAAVPTQQSYGAAVEARFTDPSVTYRTPAFQDARSGFTTNAELQTVLRSLARDNAPLVSLLPLGSSQTGIPIEALLFTRNADSSPAALLRSGRPTVLLVGQQHGDEPAGSEALLVLAQELARGSLQGLLDRINVVILPRANPDGAQSNQRLTASGIDANRDHLLLKTPEAQAQARLAREYQPVVVVDAHEYTPAGHFLEKFGGVQGYDALLQYAMTANVPEFVTKASEEWFRQPMLASMKQQGLSTEWYHLTSNDLADKKLAMGSIHPDNSRNVNGLRNAVSLLVETRGVGLGRLHLKRRVHTHVTAITAVLKSAAERAPDLIKLRQYVDAAVSAQACQGQTLVEASPTPTEYTLQMLDPVSGADKELNVNWDSALVLQEDKTRARPCGYWLASDQSDAVLHLRGLGIRVEQIAAVGVMQGETYAEAARPRDAAAADQRAALADATGAVRKDMRTVPTLVDVPAGSFYVSLAQPMGNLVIAALEPDTATSFVTQRIITAASKVVRVTVLPTAKLTPVP